MAAMSILLFDIGLVVPFESWGANQINGIDAKKLTVVKREDLRNVTFAALSTSPYLEPPKSATDDQRKNWGEVISAVFPEDLNKLKGMGLVQRNESEGNHLVTSDRAKLRLATAHLFAIQSSPFGQSKHAFRQYSKFIATVPLEEVNRAGNPYGDSAPELFDAFFNSGGQLVFVTGGDKSLEVQARSWEKDNDIKLRGGSTLKGVSIILTPQPPELCWPENGGVKISLIRREIDAAKIVAHGKGFLDVAMMKDAVRAEFTSLIAGKGEWQQTFYRHLKADLKAETGLVAKMDALEAMTAKKVIPQEAFLDAALDIVSESLTAQAYPEDMTFINRAHYGSLLLGSPLLEPSESVPYPGYTEVPRNKATSSAHAIGALKGIVVSKAIHDADMEAKYNQLAESFLKESDLEPAQLSAIRSVFQGMFDAFGGRRGDFLVALKQRQNSLQSDATVQGIEEKRETYLFNMAPFGKAEFVDAAYDGFLELQNALKP